MSINVGNKKVKDLYASNNKRVLEIQLIDSNHDSHTSYNAWQDYTLKYPYGLPNNVIRKYNGNDSIVIIPTDTTVKQLDTKVFANCSSIVNVTLPTTITEIPDTEYEGSGCFYNCPNLETVDLTTACTSIGSYTFKNCPKFANIYNTGYIKFVGIDAFPSTFSNYHIRDKFKYIDQDTFINAGFDTAYSENTQISASDWRYTHIILYDAFYEAKLTSVTLSDNIMQIGHNAFAKNADLTEVKFSDTYGNNSSLEIIDSIAFEYCTALTKITLPTTIKKIGSRAFDCCYNLSNIQGSISGYIGDEAFSNCNLYNYTSCHNITYIGRGAFSGNTNLITLDYRSTMADWEAIEKHYSWRSGSSIRTIHCTDGDITL